MRQIEATISVIIELVSGPPIEDADHIRRWICADGQWLTGQRNGFTYEVCTGHANPDDCPASCGRTFALYSAAITGADWND